MKKIRIFEKYFSHNDSTLNWRLVTNDETEWLTLCGQYLNKLWDLEDATKIEVVLTDEKVSDSHKVTIHSAVDGIDSYDNMEIRVRGSWVCTLLEQKKIITKFIAKYGICYIYVNLLEYEGDSI